MEPPQGPGSSAGGPDWNKLKAAKGADRLILVAGLLFLVDSFLPWYGYSVINISGWSSGGLAILSILFAIAALALAATQVAGASVQLPFKPGMAYLVTGGGALLFAVLRFVTETRLTKYGLFIAIILGAVLAYAGYMKYKAAPAA